MAAVRALSVVTSTLATCASSGRTRYMSAPPASTAEMTGCTPRRAASAPAASAASLAASYVRAGTSVYESAAAAPAIEIASSSSGVLPLVPIAPMTSSPAFSGMPPVRHDAPCSASAPMRPPVTCSSISRLGRTKIAAVRALSTATRGPATSAPGARRTPARARDLRAGGAAQLDELAPRVHDGEDDARARLPCLLLGGGEHGGRAVVVDDLAGSDDRHVMAPHDWGRVVGGCAAKTASPAVISRTSRRGPPKVKFTAPPGT